MSFAGHVFDMIHRIQENEALKNSARRRESKLRFTRSNNSGHKDNAEKETSNMSIKDFIGMKQRRVHERKVYMVKWLIIIVIITAFILFFLN